MEAKQEYRSSVYVWGSTAHGALGCPDTKVKAAATKKVQLVPKKLTECCTMRIMNGGNPLRVVDGNGYSTVITDKFEGYTWGDGRGGGGSSERRNASVALRANAGPCKMKKVHASSITSIAHGIGHNYALSLKGELYCWGDVNYLVHGTGKPANSIDHHGRPRPKIRAGGNESRQTFTHPTKIDIGVHSSKVTAVACGEKHACILLQNGTIMTSGANDAGQLGLGVIHELKEKGRGFHIIQSVRRGNSCLNCVTFKELACGNNHCAAISSDGASLYTWGWGDAGRLGMGNEKMHNQPTCVESLSIFAPFAVVSCGSAQTLVATEGGDVYGFGWNAHGQVSGAIKYDHTGGLSDSCQLPVLCLKNKGVVKLSCSGFHSAAITLAGDLYMWGMNEDGECGAGHEQLITAPSKVSFPDTEAEQYAVAVSCGRSFTVCIMSNYLPLEAEDFNNQLQKETLEAESVNKRTFAAQVIARFARRLLRKKPAPVIQIVDVDPPPDNASEEFQLDESSSSSSNSSISVDVIAMNAEAEPQVEDQFIDTQKVSEEDLHSSVDMSPVAVIGQQNDVQDVESGVEQEITEAGSHNMRAEAVISRILHEQPEPIRSPKQKSDAAPVRDDQIDKAATRMKLARERREQQAVAKKILPRVQRSAATKIQHERKEHITKTSLTVNVEQKSDAELAHLEWNRKLLEKRESRLKAKDQAEKEAAVIRERDMRIEREREKLVEQQTRMNLEEQKRNAKNARTLLLLKESEELKRLEEKLNSPHEMTLPRGYENKENRSNFRDLKQWTKALSGA